MKYLQLKFDEQKSDVIEHDGRQYYRSYRIGTTEKLYLRFTFISTASEYTQAIVIFLPSKFHGEVRVGNKTVEVKGHKFPKVILWSDVCPREVEVYISNVNGDVEVCNGSDPLGTKTICYCLARGSAMHMEQLSPSKYRFYCNDHVFDEDFDDLVFEMEIEKANLK